ncbi:hypothetical protein [Streptomonospora salina]|uniref:Uncharacterized protein n=1 Tax=Streptomonospora salina TaxID=104205 RepID=A0A841EAI8_9ACTN|nr:hypothetical protein [Streptomonospora salina]MBB6001047.1 hypothetical protein [Streptomonospora salina]
MVDTGLMATGLLVVLGGIALVLLGGAVYIAYQAVEDRLDERAGIPAPHGAPRPAAAPGTCADGADGAGCDTDASAGRRREHEPV